MAVPVTCDAAAGVEWLWEALGSCRHAHAVVMQLAPAHFDWNSVHVVQGTPLMAAVNEIVRSGEVSREVRALLLWCQEQGADPRRTAPSACGHSGGWGNSTDEFPLVPRVPHMGKSAITLVLGLLTVLERISIYEHKGKYREQLFAAKQLLQIFSQFRAGVPTKPVADGAVEMWEGIRGDLDRADVELHVVEHEGHDARADHEEALPGDVAGGGRVMAHSLVLCQASAVLRASLASGMQEGQTRVILVPGATVEAVQQLLSVIYLGELPHGGAAGGRSARSRARGEAVEADWRGRGAWWPGRVSATHADGSCDVEFDGEGGFAERRVPPARLRSPRATAECRRSDPLEQLRTQLTALDVAHRWQVGHAVRLFEQCLARELQDDSSSPRAWSASARSRAEHMRKFELLCDAATLKDLPVLLSACRLFAAENTDFRRHLDRGGLGPAAARVLNSSSCRD